MTDTNDLSDDLVRAVKPVHNLAARFHVGGVGLIDLADGNGIAAGTAAGFDCMLAGNRHCEFENLVAVLCGKLLAVHKAFGLVAGLSEGIQQQITDGLVVFHGVNQFTISPL